MKRKTADKREREKRIVSGMIAIYCKKSSAKKKKGSDYRMKFKKILLIILGCVGIGLGAVGAVVPLLPAFPFLLIAAVCFAKSSSRLHNWFTGTKLYKNNLESYLKGRGMTKKAKIKLIITVTVLMSVGFIIMAGIPIGRIILACIWVFHILYFLFGVKTISK